MHKQSPNLSPVSQIFIISFHYFQRNCIEFALTAKPVRRYIPKNPMQYKLWAFVTSPPFEYTIFAMILINTLSLAMKFYRQPEGYTNFLDVLNVIFTVFFTLEFLLKLAAFRFKVSSQTATLRFEGINESRRSFPLIVLP